MDFTTIQIGISAIYKEKADLNKENN